jgi:hypothetical protein
MCSETCSFNWSIRTSRQGFPLVRKNLLTVSKKLLTVRKKLQPSENLCSLNEDYVCSIFSDCQHILYDRQQFFMDRHTHDNCAGLCFTLRDHDSDWKRFSLRGIAWFSTFYAWPDLPAIDKWTTTQHWVMSCQ